MVGRKKAQRKCDSRSRLRDAGSVDYYMMVAVETEIKSRDIFWRLDLDLVTDWCES